MVAYFDVLPLYTLGMRSVNDFLGKNYTSFGYTFPVFTSIVQTLSTVYRIVFIYKAVLVRQKKHRHRACPDDDAKLWSGCELYVRMLYRSLYRATILSSV